MKTKDLIKVLGIMPKVKGYYYINDAVEIIKQRGEEPLLITKDIYPEVAHKYGTSPECVERAIRTSINNAWSNNKEIIDQIVGYPLRFRPSNKEFLFMVSDYIIESEETLGDVQVKEDFTKKITCDRIMMNF